MKIAMKATLKSLCLGFSSFFGVPVYVVPTHLGMHIEWTLSGSVYQLSYCGSNCWFMAAQDELSFLAAEVGQGCRADHKVARAIQDNFPIGEVRASCLTMVGLPVRLKSEANAASVVLDHRLMRAWRAAHLRSRLSATGIRCTVYTEESREGYALAPTVVCPVGNGSVLAFEPTGSSNAWHTYIPAIGEFGVIADCLAGGAEWREEPIYTASAHASGDRLRTARKIVRFVSTTERLYFSAATPRLRAIYSKWAKESAGNVLLEGMDGYHQAARELDQDLEDIISFGTGI